MQTSDLELEKYLQKPRRFGTKENKITQNLLEHKLKDEHLNISIQNFFYEPSLNFFLLIEIFLLIIYIWGLLNIFLIMFFQLEYVWSYFLWMLSFILVYLFRTSFFHDVESLLIKRSLKIPKNEEEKIVFVKNGLKSADNIYFTHESTQTPNNMIILAANIDSASRSFYIPVEKLNKLEILISPILGLVSLTFFLMIALHQDFNMAIFMEILMFILLFFLFICAILSFFEIKQNRSPGAVNNGSSVIALLRLISKLPQVNLKNTIVIVAFFNGKEEYMIGSRAFCEFELPKLLEKYKIKKRNVSIITLESIGAIRKQLYIRERFSLFVPIYYHKDLKYYLKNFGNFYDFVLKEKIFSSRYSDHIPFIIKNYNAVNIYREFPESYTEKDTSEKISEENIESTVMFLKKFIEAKDEDLKFEMY